MPGNITPEELNQKIVQVIQDSPTINRQKEALKAYSSATSHDFFLTGPTVYSSYRAKNNVKFLYTGEDYFEEIAKAIDNAKETIYITGWQINYDVLLKTPEARSKKKELEALEKELASAEELIKKLYILSKPAIAVVLKEIETMDTVDITPTVKKIISSINAYNEKDGFQLDLKAERDAIINYIISKTNSNESSTSIEQEKQLKIQTIKIKGPELQGINIEGLNFKILNPVEQTIEVCYNDGTCDHIEIKNIINDVYKALKLEEKIKQLVEEANSGLKDSLWEHLRKAVLRGVKVYIMPWSCPPVGPVQTFDLDTMLAVFQLNAGLEEQRAFFTFSTLDSDMGPVAGLFYSHHQKSVVVDHKIGFVGGMDLAYGRRDDKSFNLDASVRFGNDRYNPCIPHMQQALRSTHVSRMALALSTLYEISNASGLLNQANMLLDIQTTLNNWWNTPSSWDVAYDIRKELQPLHDSFNNMIENKKEQILSKEVDPILSYYFTNGIDNLIMLYKVLWGVNSVVNAYSAYSTYHPMTIELQSVTLPYLDIDIPYINFVDWEAVDNFKRRFFGGEKYVALNNIARAYETGQPIRSAYYNEAKIEIYLLLTKTKVGQLYSEIMGLDFFKNIPDKNNANEPDISAMSLLWHTFFLFQDRAIKLKEPYFYLDKKLQPLMPAGGVTLNDASQPRMPWHDIAVKISGPSVYDLSRNFVSRWNTSQAKIEEEYQPIDKNMLLGILYWAKNFIEQPSNGSQKSGLDISNIIPENVKEELAKLGEELIQSKANIVWLNPNDIPQPENIQTDPDGDEAQVQIIRSAPIKMLQADMKAMLRMMEKLNINKIEYPQEVEPPTDTLQTQLIHLLNKTKKALLKTLNIFPQTDSQEAWTKAIKASQYFLYIETQFFQSNYGVDDGYRKKDDEDKKITSGPLQMLSTIPPELKEYNIDQAIEKIDVEEVNWKKLRALANEKPRKFLELLGKISDLFVQLAQKRALQEAFAGQDIKETDAKERNAIIEAIAQRIEYAIREEAPYHVYLVIPVHPEGKLNDATVMHTVHLAMQTLVNGENSLIKRIQRSLCIHALMKDGKTFDQAKAAAEVIQANKAPLFTQYENWTDYLTLLNLRTWDKFTGRGITEQIYVHSKMLIADDNVAIVGSANANDRSMLGNRDSELGAIIKGTEPIKVELFGDGEQYTVSKVVHEFRKGLWSKLFAVEAKNVQIKPAFSGGELTKILNQPVNKATWQAIQQVASNNADRYNEVFNFIPQNDSPKQDPKQVNLGPYQIPAENYYPLGCSIWPTWSYNDPNNHNKGGKIKAPLPFEERFWSHNEGDKAEDAMVRYEFPENIRGFFVALPIKWTQGENNTSSFHHYIVS